MVKIFVADISTVLEPGTTAGATAGRSRFADSTALRTLVAIDFVR